MTTITRGSDAVLLERGGVGVGFGIQLDAVPLRSGSMGRIYTVSSALHVSHFYPLSLDNIISDVTSTEG